MVLKANAYVTVWSTQKLYRSPTIPFLLRIQTLSLTVGKVLQLWLSRTLTLLKAWDWYKARGWMVGGVFKGLSKYDQPTRGSKKSRPPKCASTVKTKWKGPPELITKPTPDGLKDQFKKSCKKIDFLRKNSSLWEHIDWQGSWRQFLIFS